MKNTLLLALCQFNMAWENKKKNQLRSEKFIMRAATKGADIVIFPEMTLTGFSMNVQDIGEEQKKSETKIFFSEQAKKNKIAIIFGMVEKEKKKGKNVLYMIDEKGNFVARYEKIHPFRYAQEDLAYVGGTEPTFITYKGFTLSFLICYDLRFPGLMAIVAQQHPHITIAIANWPQSRIKHFQILLQARALDIQSFVVGVNRTGKGNQQVYSGGSQVYSPQGVKKISLGRQEMGFVTLQKKEVDDYRKAFPFLQDTKPSVYKKYL